MHVSELGHFDVVVVDGAEARLIFQAEDENHRVHPAGKLWRQKKKRLQQIRIQNAIFHHFPGKNQLKERILHLLL